MSGGTRSYEMARRLVAKGHQVVLITTNRDREQKERWEVSEEEGIIVHWLNLPYSNKMAFYKRLSAFIKFAIFSSLKAISLKGDVVFATSTPLTVGIPGVVASWFNRIPLVFEIRDLWPTVPIAIGALRSRFSIWLAKKLEKLIYVRSKRVVAVAPGMRDHVIEVMKGQRPVDIIPNGCDFSLFGNPKNTAESTDIWTAVDPKRRLRGVYIGTVGNVNGVHAIVDLARAALDAYGKDAFCFLIVGDGVKLTEVKTKARKVGVFNQNLYFHPAVVKSVVPRILAFADFSLITYSGAEVIYRDSVCNKFFDSLAAGKPVVSNFYGYSSKLSKRYAFGYIFNDNDSQGEVKKIKNLFENPSDLQAMGAKAKAFGKKYFSRDDLANLLEESLSKAAGKIDDDCEVGQHFDQLLQER